MQFSMQFSKQPRACRHCSLSKLLIHVILLWAAASRYWLQSRQSTSSLAFAVSRYQHAPNIPQYSRNLPRSPFWSQVQVATPSDGIEVLLSNDGPDQCGPKAGSIEDCSGDNRVSALGCGYMAEFGIALTIWQLKASLECLPCWLCRRASEFLTFFLRVLTTE